MAVKQGLIGKETKSELLEDGIEPKALNIIKMLFLKKGRAAGGVTTFQNNMLRLFNDSPNFDLFVLDDQAKSRYNLLNGIYESLRSIPFLHILFEYMYVMLKLFQYREKVDYLFIPHPFKYGLFAVLSSSLFNIPFIVPIMGWTEKELRLRGASEIEIFLQLKYQSWVYRKAKYILASDDLIKGNSKIIKDKNKFLSFYSFIDTDSFFPMQKSEFLIDKLNVGNRKIISTAAPLEGVKAEGIKMLLKAFVLIKKEYNNVILLIAGDGQQKKELEDLAENLDVKNDVLFLGYWNNMPEFMNLVDVFTLIFSFGGGVGMAIMEAMACEKPCVVSKTPGTEFFKNGEEVLLASPDSKEIADKIISLLKDEEYARKIGINARKRIEAECSIKVGGGKLFNKLSEDYYHERKNE